MLPKHPQNRTDDKTKVVIYIRGLGQFGNALLIGNVEDGKINAFDVNTGAFLGLLTLQNGDPIVIPGLWELSFGGPHGGRPNQLFFDAGPKAPSFAGNGALGSFMRQETTKGRPKLVDFSRACAAKTPLKACAL